MTDSDSDLPETEFGVPIPGVILPEGDWARTALKKVPAGIIDFQELFHRQAPVILDIGCGNGRFTLGSALRRPEYDHLAIDILPVVIRYATRRANQRGLANTRWAVIGGRELLERHIAPATLTEIHCYHPQPYYRRQEIKLRLITPEFLLLCHRALVPGGSLFLQTDHPAYWNYMQKIVPIFFEFQAQTGPWPDTPEGRSRREIIATQHGLPIFRGVGKARLDLDLQAASETAARLPLPTFNADRRLQELDRLEGGPAQPGRVRRPRRK
jgi:tRNA (guanine-N7-)-methyltransferase